MDKRTFDIINKLLWDYDFSHKDVLNLIQNKTQSCGHWNFDLLFLRILERLSWYEILHLFGPDKIKKYLTLERISKIYNSELKNHFTRLRKILYGESVSFTKWGPEFSNEIKNSLFSNRWYST